MNRDFFFNVDGLASSEFFRLFEFDPDGVESLLLAPELLVDDGPVECSCL